MSILSILSKTFATLRPLREFDHPFEMRYAPGKGLVSYAEFARTRPNNAEYLAAVNGRDLPRVAESGRD